MFANSKLRPLNELLLETGSNPLTSCCLAHALSRSLSAQLEMTRVEFGSVLVDTTRRIPVRVTNCSNVEVVFSWAWDKGSMQEDASE